MQLTQIKIEVNILHISTYEVGYFI
jgi:hypothetical protein